MKNKETGDVKGEEVDVASDSFNKEVGVEQVAEPEFQVGTPGPTLMPARPHKFKILTGPITITVPASGKYPDDYSIKGSYNLIPDDGVLLYGTLTNVLFAMRLYPNLQDNQRFVLMGTEQHKEDNELVVVGQVVEVVV